MSQLTTLALINRDVHVIVCTYNAQDTLEECIDSILSQSYTNFTLWIIDDGSKDDSQPIIENFRSKDERIKTVRKENSGYGDSANLAINLVKKEQGQYIALCGADDIWHPQKLEFQLQLFESTSNLSMAVTEMQLYLNKEPFEWPQIPSPVPTTELHGLAEEICNRNFPFAPATVLIKTDCFIDNVKFSTHKSGQDFLPFLIFALQNKKCVKILSPLYGERKLQGSLQRSPDSEYLGGKARVDAIRKILSREVSVDITDSQIKFLNSGHDRFVGWMLSGARKIMPWKQYLLLSIKQFPKQYNKTKALVEIIKCLFYPLFKPLKEK